MATPQLPTRTQVDRAEPLDFPERRPAEKPVSITIEASPAGLVVRVDYQGTLSSIPAAIERLRAAGILELVSAARSTPTPAPASMPQAEKFCPLHGDPMKPMSRPDKSGATHWCTKKVGDGFCKERA